MNNLDRAKIASDYGKNFISIRYIWGGNDTSAGGFDCSGFVLECLRSVGLWGKEDSSAQGIFNILSKKCELVTLANHGDIVFFGNSTTKITHIGIMTNEWQFIEAGGGDSTNMSGMVRIRPLIWRRDRVAVLRFL